MTVSLLEPVSVQNPTSGSTPRDTSNGSLLPAELGAVGCRVLDQAKLSALIGDPG